MSQRKRFFLGTLVIFLLGSGFHFFYDLFGKSILAAPFFPVNESVWEHMKLLSTAALVWLAADFFLAEKRLRPGFFAARASAMPLALLLMPMIYYLLKSGFGVENLFVDIANFLVVAAAYQFLATRFEACCDEISRFNAAGVAVLAVLLLLYAAMTFLPPHLPIFQDPPTGGYGIIG